jgi:hypothetical protein
MSNASSKNNDIVNEEINSDLRNCAFPCHGTQPSKPYEAFERGSYKKAGAIAKPG